MNWLDASEIGYPALFGGVLLGSIIPVVPTGAVVGAAAAFAMTTSQLSLPLVILLATVSAIIGDIVTYAVPRFGSEAALRWVSGRQQEDKLVKVREQFRKRGWQIIVIGRLVPAGRIPVLLAAGALMYPWRRVLPAIYGACLLWAIAYALLGIVSGGIFDSPLIATLLATVLVLLITVVMSVISRYRRRRTRPITSSPFGGHLMSERLIVYGTGWCPDVKRSRAYLDSAGVEYDYVDVEADQAAEDAVRLLQDGNRKIPTIVWPDGRHLVEPTDEELAEQLR